MFLFYFNHFPPLFLLSFKNHTAVGRVVQIIEATEGESLPKGDLIMQAYLHFEALSDLDYIYSCVSCGYNPCTVIMDLHKKGVFSIPGKYKVIVVALFPIIILCFGLN